MTTKGKKRNGLSNPALVSAASSPAGQKAIGGALDTSKKVAEVGISLIPFLVKTGIVLGVGYIIYTKFKKRFISMGYNNNLEPANISDGQARAKADALFTAMYGPGTNFTMVKEQLAGLNYNGWVKVYNAFGNRKGINPLGDSMNLVEWLNDELSTSELIEARFLLPGVF